MCQSRINLFCLKSNMINFNRLNPENLTRTSDNITLHVCYESEFDKNNYKKNTVAKTKK